MKKIRVFEAFAGIGAQRKALERANIPYESVGISEWFTNAIIAYDIIHEEQRPVKITDLSKITLSTDSSTPWKKTSKQINDLSLALAFARTKNFGSILDLKGSQMPRDIDLFTYSFPCQDLSTGGKNAGIKEGTRSGLLLEVERLLIEMQKDNNLPKSLMMENVPPLLSNTHLPAYKRWLDQLEKMGYKTITLTLDSSDFGLAQSRKRVFAISSLDHDMIEGFSVDQYKVKMPSPRSFLFLDKKYRDEMNEVQLNGTPSREIMWKINGRTDKELDYRPFNTITTNMDRQNNAGLLKYRGPKGDTYRMLTPRESFVLFGFDEKDFQKLKERTNWSWRKYNKLIGNSIPVNVLEAIFKEMFNAN